MTQELTIQAVEGMTKAVDKMSTAFSGLKTSIGSIKGTNALKELQAVVNGVNRLETALKSIDSNLSVGLGTVVNTLNTLPRAIADAMGASVRAVREGNSKLAKATDDGAKEVAEKSRKTVSTYAAQQKAFQGTYEYGLEMRQAFNAAELRELQSYGVRLKKADRDRLAEAKLAGAQIEKLDKESLTAKLRYFKEMTLARKVQQALSKEDEAKDAASAAISNSFFNSRFRTPQTATPTRQKETAAAFDNADAQAYRATLARYASLTKADAEFTQTWEANRKRMISEIRKDVQARRALRAEAEKSTERNQTVSRVFDNAIANAAKAEEAALASRNAKVQASLRNIEQMAYNSERKKLENSAAAAEKQLQVDRIFAKAQADLAERSAKDIADQKIKLNQAVQNILRKADQDRVRQQDSFEKQTTANLLTHLNARVNAAKEAAAKMAAAQAAADKANLDSAFRASRASTSQALRKPAGDYSVYRPDAANHGSQVEVSAPKLEGYQKLSKSLMASEKAAKSAGFSLRNVGVDANDTHSAIRGLASGFNLLWLTWGNLAPLLAGAAISNGFVQTIKLGVAVQQTLDQTMVLGQMSAEAMTDLTGQVLELATKGPYGLGQVAEAVKTLTLAGLDAKEVMSALPATLDFAIAGDSDIKLAAETVTSVATAFRLTANEYSIVSDVIAKTAASSKASVDDMAEAFKASTVVHKQYGASLQDVSLGLALLSNLGVKGSAAGTALRNMFVDLSGRTPKVEKALKTLGIEVIDGQGKFLDLYTVTKNVATGLDSLGSETEKLKARNILFSERGMKPMIEALDQFKTAGEGYSDALKRMQTDLANFAGFSGLAAATLSLTSSNQIKGVFTTLQASAFNAFSSIEPLIVGVTNRLKGAFKSEEFVKSLQTLMSVLANTTVFLVENGKAILSLLAAYTGLKAVGFVSGVFAAIAASSAAAATSLGLARLTVQTVGTGMLGASGSAVTFGGALTKVAAGSGLATAGLTTLAGVGARVFGFLAGPWGLAITAAATLFGVYSAAANKAADAKDRFSGERSQAFLTELKERSERLKVEIDAINKGEDAQAALEKASANKELLRTQKQLNDALKEQAGIAERLRNLGGSETPGKAKRGQASDSSAIVAARRELGAAKLRTEAARKENEGMAEGIDTFLALSRKKVAAEESQRAAREANDRDSAKFGNAVLGDSAGAAGNTRSNELAQIQQQARNKLSALEKHSSEEARLLQKRRTENLISEGEYLVKLNDLTAKAERAKLNAIAEASADYEAVYIAQRAKLSGTERDNLDRSRSTFDEAKGQEKLAVESDRTTRLKTAALEAEGAMKRLQDATKAFWDLDKQKANTESSFSTLAKNIGLTEQATATFVEEAVKAAAPYQEAYKKVNDEVTRLKVNLDIVGASTAQGRQIAEALKAAEAEAAKFETTISRVGQSAGVEKLVEDFLKMADNDAAKGYDRMGRALAGVVNSITSATSAWEAQKNAISAVSTEIELVAAAHAEATKAGDYAKAAEDSDKLAKLESRRASVIETGGKAQQRSYANIIGAAKGMFKENSRGYKAMETAEKAFRAYELAMSIKSIATKAFEWAAKITMGATGESAVTAQTAAGEASRNALKVPGVFMAFMSQLGPYGITAAAAAIAAIGLSVAGKSRGTFAPTNEGKGTVLGDSNAQSKSINNAIEKLADNSSIELQYSSGMLAALRSIEANIGGVTNQILRGNVGGDAASRLGTGDSKGVNLGAMAIGGGLIGLTVGILGKYIPILGKLSQALFGKTTTVKGSGLFLDSQSLSSINASGANLKEYVDVNQSSKFLGIKYKDKNSTVTGNADANLSRQISLVFKDFYSAVSLAAVPLGQNLAEVTNRLDSFVVNIGKIDLKDLTGEQIQERLTAVLGAAGDSIAAAALPGFEAFQKAGEGYFETVVRIANSSEVAKNALDKLGITMINLKDVAAKQGDVTVELIRQSIANVETFGGSLTGVGKIVQTFAGSADDLIEVYTALLSVRENLRGVGKDAMQLSLSMIQGAGGLQQLQEGLQSYYDNFLTDQERVADMTRRLTGEFAKAGFTLPKTTDEFKSLINGINISTEAGQRNYGQVISLSEGFFKLTEAMKKNNEQATKAADEAESLNDRLKNAKEDYLKATLTEAQYAAVLRGRVDATNLALYDQVIAQEAATKAAQDAAKAAADLKKAWEDAGKGIADEISRIRGTTPGGQTLASAQSAFSIAVAQAQAGDASAAKELPKLSQNLLKIAEDSAKSSMEFQQFQSSTLAALERTLRYITANQGVEIPGFAAGGLHSGGARIVGERGPELEVTGPARVYSAQQTSAMLNPSYDELVGQVARLSQLVEQLVQDQRAYGGAIAASTASTAKVMRDLAPDRDALNVRIVTP